MYNVEINVSISGVKQARSYHAPANWKYWTMNDLAQPKGCWQAAHKAQQSRYNALLAFSVVFCFGSAAIVSNDLFMDLLLINEVNNKYRVFQTISQK